MVVWRHLQLIQPAWTGDGLHLAGHGPFARRSHRPRGWRGSKALSRLGEAEAAALAEEVGLEFGKQMAASMGPGTDSQRSFRSALHVVADALSAHGFAAHAEKDGDQLRIITEHCPFGEAVIEHPVICAVDRGMVSGMLGALYGETPVDLKSSLPKGDPRCITSIDS